MLLDLLERGVLLQGALVFFRRFQHNLTLNEDCQSDVKSEEKKHGKGGNGNRRKEIGETGEGRNQGHRRSL